MLSISIHFYFNSIHFYSFLFISTNSYSCLVIHLYLYSFLMKSYSSLFIFNQDLCIFIHFYLNAVHFPRIEHHPKASSKQTENVSLAKLFNHLWGGVHDPQSLGPNIFHIKPFCKISKSHFVTKRPSRFVLSITARGNALIAF